MKIENDHGLFVDSSTTPPTLIGYIMNFEGRGAYAPTGKVEATPEQIKVHNALLAEAEVEGLKKNTGTGLCICSVQFRKGKPIKFLHRLERGPAGISLLFMTGEKAVITWRVNASMFGLLALMVCAGME